MKRRMILELFSLVIVLQNGRCSYVIDSHSQKPYAFKYSDYCDGGAFCKEGAHVLCLYFDPKNKMGPKCNYQQGDDMLSITPDLAYLILDIVNAARSRVAKGEEKGKNDEPLPRGYGLFRLKWDNELAAFSQMWVDQCLDENNGVCTSTKRFPNAGQIEIFTIVRPDWSNPIVQMKSGLGPDKVKTLVLEMLHAFFVNKRTVTVNEIRRYPPKSTRSYYLSMVNSFTTHMGCGVSTFIDLKYEATSNNLGTKGGIGRMMMLSCNFSSKRQEGQLVYHMQRPPYTSDCGCPVGSLEDGDNLCVAHEPETTTIMTTTSNTEAPGACTPESNCEPPVVILPIFSIDNAPPEKLVPKVNETLRTNLKSHIKQMNSISTRVVKKPCGRKPHLRTKPGRLQNVPQWHKQTAKSKLSSIFTRVKKFKLPGRDIITDVKPRKDFRKVQKLVDDYIRRKNNELETRRHNDIVAKKNLKVVTTSTITQKKEHTTEIILKSAKNITKLCESNMKPNNNIAAHDCFMERDSKSSQDDDKIMTLLNHLEQEVKHVELDGNTKQVVDAKIREIYGSVVGKPESTSVIPHIVDNKLSTSSRDLSDTRTIFKHEYNHISDDDPHKHDIDNFLNNEQHIDTNNIEKYFKKKFEYEHLEDDDEDNDINNGQRIYRDIERKYDDRHRNKLSMNELNQKYDENDNTEPLFHHKWSDVMSRNQNHLDNYEDEEKYHREPHKYHTSDLSNYRSRDIETHNIRNMEDKRSRKMMDDNRGRKKDFGEDDPLSVERRKYYPDKIENLERRIHSVHFRHGDNRAKERHLRRMRPNLKETNVRKTRSKLQGDSYYMPERARFLHGF